MEAESHSQRYRWYQIEPPCQLTIFNYTFSTSSHSYIGAYCCSITLHSLSRPQFPSSDHATLELNGQVPFGATTSSRSHHHTIAQLTTFALHRLQATKLSTSSSLSLRSRVFWLFLRCIHIRASRATASPHLAPWPIRTRTRA